MSYKVLLVDDQHNESSLAEIKKMAKMANIELIGERFHVQGMEILKNDSSFEYQAVILDATGYKKSDIDEKGLHNRGLFYSLNFLRELKSSRIIPWFIYTGAPRNLSNEKFVEPISEYQNDIKFGRDEFCYYTKTFHEKELLQDIIEEINNLEQTKIEYQFRRVFEIAKKINIPIEDTNHLVTIFKSIQSNKINLEPSLYFTQLRKYVEYVFRGAAKYNILHEKCIDKDGKVNLTDSSLFLAGVSTKHSKPNKVSCTKTHFSKIMAENIKNLLFITGTASHTSDVDPAKNMDYQSYREQIKTPYLLYQLTFTICDLLIWYENLIDQNPDPEENKKLWREVVEENEENNWIEGKVIKSDSKDFAFFRPKGATKDSDNIYIHKSNVVKFNLTDGIEINATSVFFQDPNGKTKTQVKNIQLIETTEESSI